LLFDHLYLRIAQAVAVHSARDLCDSLSRLASLLSDARAFLISPAFESAGVPQAILEALAAPDARLHKRALDALIRFAALPSSPFPVPAVAAAALSALSSHPHPDAVRLFKLFRAIGPAVFDFAPLPALAQACLGPWTVALPEFCGLLFDLSQGELPAALQAEVLCFIAECHTAGATAAAPLNLWALRELIIRMDFAFDLFCELGLHNFVVAALGAGDPDVQSPALICLGKLFEREAAPPWNDEDVYRLFEELVRLVQTAIDDDLFVNALCALTRALAKLDIAVDIVAREGIWEHVLGLFDDAAFEVKFTVMLFIFEFVGRAGDVLLAEMIEKGLLGWFAVVFTDGRARRPGLRAFVGILARLMEAPEGRQSELHEAADLARELCEAHPDRPESEAFLAIEQSSALFQH
jgi:hypothetical protein